MSNSARRSSPAALRNREPILDVLRGVLPPHGTILEVASGSGEHVVHFAQALPHLTFQPTDPTQEALASIKDTSKSALDEVRSLLGVLRTEGGDLSAPLVPEPDLSRLPGLVASVNTQGVEVTLDNTVDAAPKAVQLAVYRIVQEALTNVVKHAAPTSCRVRVDVAETEVRVDVTNQGRQGSHGLAGMRERVVMFDGSLAAGPRPGGGFAVSARLSYD